MIGGLRCAVSVLSESDCGGSFVSLGLLGQAVSSSRAASKASNFIWGGYLEGA